MSSLLPGSTLTELGVKRAIKQKFGNFTRFCKLAKIRRYEDFQKFFQAYAKKKTPERYKHLEKLMGLCKTTIKQTPDNEITRDQVKLLTQKIEEAGGVRQFCKDHKRFKVASVWQIITGKRRFKSKKVVDLLKTLKVK